MPEPTLATPPAGSFDPDQFDPDRFVLDCRGRSLDVRPGQPRGAHVMGILNVTPDSFSDGGQFMDVEDAVARAGTMLDEGATLIDVGGESTRPGADPVDIEEERDRVLPVIDAITARYPDALVSIDTYKPAVARAALAAGAHLVNDVTGLRYRPEIADVAAEYGAPLIVMHSVNTPGALTHPHDYGDVVDAVQQSLARSVRGAEEAGVRHIITDPGFGFGKTTAENLRLINTVDRLLTLNRPVLVGLSRKSSIGAVLGTAEESVPVGERLFGTLGATAVAVMRGATLVRAHDVRPTVELLRALGTTLQAR